VLVEMVELWKLQVGVGDEHFTSDSATLPRKEKTHSQSLWWN